MIRLLLRLFRITDFEPNESVAVLKQQLDYERERNKELTEILVNLLKPQVVEATPQMINPIQASSALWGRRRAALEAKDRLETQIKKSSTNLGKPDDKIREIKKLEEEMGIEEEQKEG